MEAEGPQAGAARLGQGRRQARGHRDPVHHGQHRVTDVVRPGRAGPDVLDQPRAVRADGPADSGYRFHRAGHVVDAVKGHDQVVVVVLRQVLRPGHLEVHVAQPVPGQAGPGPADRMPGRVEPLEPRGRESGGQRKKCHSGSAPHVCYPGTGGEAVDHAWQGRQDQRHEGEPGPRFCHAFHRVRRGRAEVVVAQPYPGTEGSGQPVHHLRRGDAALEGAGCEEQASVVGQDRRRLRAQLEGLTVLGVDQAGRGLATEPLEQPSLLQPGRRRQIGRGRGSLAGHGAVQAEAVAQMDHQRDHLALLVAPHPQGERSQPVVFGCHGVQPATAARRRPRRRQPDQVVIMGGSGLVKQTFRRPVIPGHSCGSRTTVTFSVIYGN